MKHLVPGFLGEGPTDRRFLEPIIRRLLAEVLRSSADAVEIYPFVDPAPASRRLVDAIAAVRACGGSINLLFVHADGKGQARRAMTERVEPILAASRSERLAGVAVVPVHETEAWALADGDALRAVFGTTASNTDLGIPGSPDEVERLPDPKQVLRSAYRRATGGRSGRRNGLPVPLALLGERVGLEALHRLQAFQVFQEDTREALLTLRLLP